MKVTQKVVLLILIDIGGLHEDKLCDTLQGMVPTSVKTVNQTSLRHVKSNPDRTEFLSPTHGQRSRQQSELTILRSILISESKFLKATRHAEIRKNEVPRSTAVEALSW